MADDENEHGIFKRPAVFGARQPMANITPFGLRMQPDLKVALEASASANERSLNAEIVARLSASLDKDQRLLELNTEHAFEMDRVRQQFRLELETAYARAESAEKSRLVLPDGLRDRIAAKAEENGRSVYEEIVQALEKAFPVPATTDDMIRVLQEMFDNIDTRRPNAEGDADESTRRLRLYLAYLIQERDAGRGDQARKGPITLDLERRPDGSIGPVSRKDGE